MLDHELHDLRRELAALERGPGKRYPTALRDRIAGWARRRAASGSPVRTSATKLELHPETLRKWMAGRQAQAIATTLVAVDVVAEPPAERRISVVSPAGFRVDGLTIEEAAALLRAVG